jgi:hypothetical protein
VGGSDRWRQLALAVAVVLGFAALAASGERGEQPAPIAGLLGRAARVGFWLALLTGASLSSRQLYLRGQADLAKTLVRLAWDGAVRKDGRA